MRPEDRGRPGQRPVGGRRLRAARRQRRGEDDDHAHDMRHLAPDLGRGPPRRAPDRGDGGRVPGAPRLPPPGLRVLPGVHGARLHGVHGLPEGPGLPRGTHALARAARPGRARRRGAPPHPDVFRWHEAATRYRPGGAQRPGRPRARRAHRRPRPEGAGAVPQPHRELRRRQGRPAVHAHRLRRRVHSRQHPDDAGGVPDNAGRPVGGRVARRRHGLGGPRPGSGGG